MAFTNTGSTAILNGLIGKTSSGPLSSCSLAISRPPHKRAGPTYQEPTGPQNKEIIFYPEASASWGTLTHFGLYSAANGGNLILYGALSSPITVAANYVPLFRAGNFSLTLT